MHAACPATETSSARPRARYDVLPPESDRWQAFVAAFATRARHGPASACSSRRSSSTRGRAEARREHRRRAQGDVRLRRRGRPAARAARRRAPRRSCARSSQHQPATPWKVWYVAPNFRYERPQKGRYRQHWQVGVEVLGVDDPDVDVEVIELAARLLPRDLGLRRVPPAHQLDGRRRDAERATATCCSRTGVHHADAARRRDGARRGEPVAHPRLEARRLAGHDRSARRRSATTSPTRPPPTSRRVQEGLHALGIPFEIAPRLVRGLDYYTGTTFEFQSDALDAAQNAIGGGGRYDGSSSRWAARRRRRSGSASGSSGRLIVCDAEGVFAAPRARGRRVRRRHGRRPRRAHARRRAARGRASSADRAYGNRSMKKQWGAADRAGRALGRDARRRGSSPTARSP